MKKFNKIITIFFIAIMFIFSVTAESNAFDVPKFNPKAKEITPGFYRTNNMNYEHSIYSAVKLKDSRILIVGGADIDDNKANIEIFNPKTFKFTKVSKPIYNHYYLFNSIVFDNGKVLLISDNDEDGENRVYFFEIYDPKKNMFDDTVYSINGECVSEFYKTKDGNAVIYCKEYTDKIDDKTNSKETVQVMHVYNYNKERFEPPLYSQDKGYIDQNDLAKENCKTEDLHSENTVFIKIPDKNMILITGIDIPKEIKDAKTLEEIKTCPDLGPQENMSKKVHVFVYEK